MATVTTELPKSPAITTHVDLIQWLVRAAIEHAPARLYAEAVADFTDAIVERLLDDGDVHGLKFPPDDTPSLLASMMESLSGETIDADPRWCSPVLVRVASELYACDDPPSERAIWLLLGHLNISANGRDLFEQLELGDAKRRSQTFLVSTERFEREFRMTAMVPVHFMSIAHRHKTRKMGASEKWPEYSVT
jgi:hypothetical protein